MNSCASAISAAWRTEIAEGRLQMANIRLGTGAQSTALAEAQGIEPSEPQSNPAPVLKTGEPTRRPDASIAQASEVSMIGW